jgi:hypothetical protein
LGPPPRLEEPAEVLARLERSGRKGEGTGDPEALEGEVSQGRRAEEHWRNPLVRNGDPAGIDSEVLDDLVPDRHRGDDHTRRPVDRPRHQVPEPFSTWKRVVALERQIVHGHHPRRTAGGRQDEVRRMHNVGIPREPGDRRSAKAAPQRLSRPRRHTPPGYCRIRPPPQSDRVSTHVDSQQSQRRR